MTKVELLTKWLEIKSLYEAWISTIPKKHTTGETIYTQFNKILSSIVADIEKLNEETVAASAKVNNQDEIDPWLQTR